MTDTYPNTGYGFCRNCGAEVYELTRWGSVPKLCEGCEARLEDRQEALREIKRETT